MDLSNLIANCRAYTAEQSTIELLPKNQAAVYAFYDLLNFPSTTLIDSIDRFKTKHARRLTLRTEQLPFMVSLQLRGGSDRFKGEGRKLCSTLNGADAQEIRNQFLFLSFLNEPLYVGKTEDVRIRFSAHHDNGFLFRMKDKHQRSPDEFLFFAFFCKPEHARLMESVLIQIINPPFCDQKT